MHFFIYAYFFSSYLTKKKIWCKTVKSVWRCSEELILKLPKVVLVVKHKRRSHSIILYRRCHNISFPVYPNRTLFYNYYLKCQENLWSIFFPKWSNSKWNTSWMIHQKRNKTTLSCVFHFVILLVGCPSDFHCIFQHKRIVVCQYWVFIYHAVENAFKT